MPTFEITIYIRYPNISLTKLSLLMSLAATEGLDIDVGVGLQRDPPQYRSQRSVAETDGTFLQHMRKTAEASMPRINRQWYA